MAIDKLGEKTVQKLPDRSNINGTGNKDNDNIGTATSDKAVITNKHVKEFTPLLKKDINVTIPKEHQEWINLFKVLEKHGLSVAGTETKEELHKTLEHISPAECFLFGGTKCLDIKIGKDAKSNENEIVTIYLPKKGVESLAQHLRYYETIKKGSKMSASSIPPVFPPDEDAINSLKDLVGKGAELYLEIPPENRFSSNNKLHSRLVKVSPEIFHWFMNNPTYIRQKGAKEMGFTNAMAMTAMITGGLPPYPYALFSVLKKETVINGGMIDAKADGQPNKPAIHGKNWKEFSANLKELSHEIDIKTKKEKVAQEEFNLYQQTPKEYDNKNTVKSLTLIGTTAEEILLDGKSATKARR